MDHSGIIPDPEWELINPIVGNTMLELGNKETRGVTYKSLFESMGITHTSIDWNGLDGALNLDLREPINIGTFDMVTNIGTTEHVDNQEGVWENIHNFIKVGGVFVSTTPANWPHHGLYHPRMEFFEEFCKNGYEIEIMEEVGRPARSLLFVRLHKFAHKAFKMPDKRTIYKNVSQN